LREDTRAVATGMNQAVNVPLLWKTTDEFMSSVTYWRDVLWLAVERSRDADCAVDPVDGAQGDRSTRDE
jgi:hypothetical protein